MTIPTIAPALSPLPTVSLLLVESVLFVGLSDIDVSMELSGVDVVF